MVWQPLSFEPMRVLDVFLQARWLAQIAVRYQSIKDSADDIQRAHWKKKHWELIENKSSFMWKIASSLL